MTVAARVSLVVTMGGLFAAQLSSAPGSSRSTALAAVAPGPAAASVHRPAVLFAAQPNTDTDPALDLYGNAVNVAVAEYKIDAVGRLYELHSPQSELPRLGSPKS